ncbi:MAG: FAD/NAD(P)-binding protein [Clostridium sp.]|nr:FAD/NAD(P)-binding protein [Clostridium sp.]
MSNLLIPDSAVVRDVFHENDDTSTFSLQFTDAQKRLEYSFQPGQFNMLSIFGVGEAPISISSSNGSRENFTHTIRHVGSLTRMFARLKEGDLLGVRGPYGNGWPLKQAHGKNLLIVAGGIGLAPLRPAIYNILEQPALFGKVELLYGSKNPGEMLFRHEYRQWAEQISMLLTVDNASGFDWNHNTGLVTALFDKMQSVPENTLVLSCGPEIMMKHVVRGLLARGFHSGQLYVSLERKMFCGVKKCGRCQVGSKFVCHDGPVFSYDVLENEPAEIIGVLGRE